MDSFFSFDFTLLHTLSALCTPQWDDNGTASGMVGVMAIAGLAGGFSHCGPMCGVFVLAQVEKRLATVPSARMCEAQRIAGAVLPWYHLGRLVGYAGLGALTAWVGGGIASLPGFGLGATILLALAALAFGFQALSRFRPKPIQPSTLVMRKSKAWSKLIGRLAGLVLHRSTPLNGLALGLILSLLPCGLLYSALAAASASARPLAGALGMAIFALGTVPSLIAIGLFGHLAGWHFRQWQQKLAPYLLLLNALLLGGLAIKIAA